MQWLGFRQLIKNKFKLFFYNFSELIVFLFLAVAIWTPLHEFLHVSVLKFLHYDYKIYWNYLLLPGVHCTNCDFYNKTQMFFYSVFPYIIDILALVIGFLFNKYKILRFLMHFGFFDIISNYFMMLVALITNQPSDFLNIIRLGFWYVAVLLFIISFYLWFKKNKDLLKGYLKKYRRVYG